MAVYRTYLCGVDDGQRVTPNPECADAAGHTPEPNGDLQWFDWAEEMARTHTQTTCARCGRWCVWVPA